MFRIILVDDEEIIRKGLTNHVNWAKYDLEVVGDFSDGLEAYEYIKTHPTDIVITDVKMPEMDGITLAKKLKEEGIEAKVIFISGHADIDYIKSALKVDAIDYILKAIDIAEIEATIERVVSQLKHEDERSRLIESLEKKLSRNLPILQQKALMLLIREELREEELNARQLNIPIEEGRYYCLMDLQIRKIWKLYSDMSEHDRLIHSLNMHEKIIEILETYGKYICFENRIGEFVIILEDDADDNQDGLLKVAESLTGMISESFGFESYIGISDRFNSICQVHSTYDRTVDAISKRFFVNESSGIIIDKSDAADKLQKFRNDTEKELRAAVFSGNPEVVKEKLTEILGEAAKLLSGEDVDNFHIFLLLLPSGFFNDSQVHSDIRIKSNRRLLEEYLSCASAQEQQMCLMGVYEEITAYYKQDGDVTTRFIVGRICEIIREEYMKQLSVTYLAERVHISSTYMCVIFKQIVGKTINEYITEVRIEQARYMLLDPSIKAYDICFRVGYYSPSYFSKIFRKYCGVTPMEYREKNLQV